MDDNEQLNNSTSKPLRLRKQKCKEKSIYRTLKQTSSTKVYSCDDFCGLQMMERKIIQLFASLKGKTLGTQKISDFFKMNLIVQKKFKVQMKLLKA